MQIGIIGYGKMGKAVEIAALERSHDIVGKLDRSDNKPIDFDDVAYASVCIDFTHPSSVLQNVARLSEMGKNLVIGTTGWYDLLPEIKSIIEINQVGAIWAPNFSLGVHIFLKIVEQAFIG